MTKSTPSPSPSTPLTFEPPGPGGWMRLADHFPNALTPEYQRLYSETCPIGMGSYMARYGVLAKTLDVGYVHGHLYISPVPLAGPREMKRTPPAAAVWLMARLHPAFRARTKAARRALEGRPWRAAAAHWFEFERDEWQARDEKIEAVDPARLRDDELVAHLDDCRSLAIDGYRRHFELHGDDLLPIGLLIARCQEWGIGPATAMRVLDGASPVSAGTTRPPDWQLVTGYDLDALAWVELETKPEPQPAPSIAALDLADRVPPECRDELSVLVADARAAVPLRDDNGGLTGAWPLGLLRRAMLEAGRRIAPSDPTLAVEFTVDELIGRLQGSSAPTLDEAEARRVRRGEWSGLDAPPRLGPEFAIPPLTTLPRALALMGAAQLATADHMLGVDGTAVGVGQRPHTGRALVVDDPAIAMTLIEPGDVVVTRFTSPTWNSILVHAGALVTTTGGLVSHAAVIARELGIPAVIGDAHACTRLHTGEMVTVDPIAGTATAA